MKENTFANRSYFPDRFTNNTESRMFIAPDRS